jgi:Carboxypeptidase regulatory-like domain/TonB dependent receptor
MIDTAIRAFRPLRLCALLLAVLSPIAVLEHACAQEFRGTISGTVKDPTGAVVREAQVTITETTTATVNRTKTDSAGQYVVPFLQPGTYQIFVESSGFKKEVRDGITLQANEHPLIDLTLQIGSAAETVSVTADAPLIDTANASVGQVISTKEVEDLPVNGRTPITLVELAVGVVPTSQPSQIHPFDNSGASSWSIGGTPAQASEVLLDGSPDTTWQGDVAYNPPQGVVKELSISVSDTDASFGHTIGGVMNQITMSGTNRFHGSVYEFHVLPLAANSYFNKRNGLTLPAQEFDQYGLTVGGPVWIPKVFDGRNKLFWYFGYESLPDSTPSTSTQTIPTDAERNGDFSALLPLGCPSGYQTPGDPSVCTGGKANPYQLYNPFTATLSGSTVTRKPIPNNILTNAGPLSAVALAYLKFYPEPNATNPNPDGENNYISNSPAVDTFNSEFYRADWNMSDRSHILAEFHRNHRTNHKNDIFNNGASGQSSTRLNLGSTVDEVYTVNNTTILNARVNWLYYDEETFKGGPFTPETVGFPSYMTAASSYPQLPLVAPGYTSLGFASASKDPSTIYGVFGDVVKILGRNTLKFGVDARQYRVDVINYAAAAGSFSYASSFVQSSSSGSAPTFGGPEASFLLGLPTSGSFFTPATANFHANYLAFFAQNDWRVTDHFTVNIGLRYDHQSPFEDKLSRVVNGFNPTAVNSASAAASAAFAANPISQVPAASFNTLGGLVFPDTQKNGAQYQTISHWVSPRIGVSYNPSFLNQHMVLRGGFSMFVLPSNLDTLSTLDVPGSSVILNQEGYSSTTSYVATNNNFLTTANTMASPFPTGFVAAVGSSLGASTNLGQSISYYAPTLRDPYALRWNLGAQYAITPNLLVELDYIGDHAVHQPIASTPLDYIPQRLLSTLPIRDPVLVPAYNATTKNPFAGLLPGTSINGSTVAVSQLLMTYPQFTGITEQNVTEGGSVYHNGSIRIEKRSSHGVSITANYSFSKLIEAMQYLNPGDAKLARIVSPYDHKQHFAMGATYEFPIGTGKLIDIHSGVWNSIVGGFKINSVYSFQTGSPLFFSADLVTTGQPITSATRVTTGKALNTAAFDTVSADQFSFHLRTLPLTFGNVRTDGINQVDSSMLKDFHFREGMYAQFRFEVFNTLNHASFSAPAVSSATSSSFGAITSQANTSRTIQFGGRLVF